MYVYLYTYTYIYVHTHIFIYIDVFPYTLDELVLARPPPPAGQPPGSAADPIPAGLVCSRACTSSPRT